MSRTIRCAAVASAALALSFTQSGVALAHHHAGHVPLPGGTTIIAPPATDTPIWTSMIISSNNGIVSYTPPGTTATPSAPSVPWTCTTTNPTLTSFHASCVPAVAAPAGQWHCAIPMVQVTMTGTAADSLSGTSECSGVVATCSATPVVATPTGNGVCESWGPSRAPVPFECLADWSSALASTNWSVRCVTVDP